MDSTPLFQRTLKRFKGATTFLLLLFIATRLGTTISIYQPGIIEEKIEDLLFNGTVVDNYAVVIDAGSTGSRAFVYKFSKDVYFTNIGEEKAMTARNITSIPCSKARPGLSTFFDQPKAAVEYIKPLLMEAAGKIPQSHHQTTKVYIKGTAGMRVLDDLIQKKIWQVLIEGLNKIENFPFSIKKFSCYGTIDGYQEAYYAVLSSNYIEGVIDGNLIPEPDRQLVGALDMGGGSTQLIFYNGTEEKTGIVPEKVESADTECTDPNQLTQSDFWSHSWLGFGVEAIKEKVLNYLYDEYVYDTLYHLPHIVEYSENHEEFFSLAMPWYSLITVIPNACVNIGYEFEYSPQLYMKGTGDGVKCMEILRTVVWPNTDEEHSCVAGKPCWINEVSHPSVVGTTFYAMSVYFYAFDCIRQLGPYDLQQWPNPSIAELETATLKFCALPWIDLHENMKNKKHEYTRPNQLWARCLEGLYMVTLLEQGFGFPREERRITIAMEVRSHEVEWTLGFALSEVNFNVVTDTLASHRHRLHTLATKIGATAKKFLGTVAKRFNGPRQSCQVDN